MAKEKQHKQEEAEKDVLSERDLEKMVKEEAEKLRQEETVPLFIPEGLGVQNPLPVCVNGAVMSIPVGREVRVPKTVYNVLMNYSNIFKKNNGKTRVDGQTLEEKVLRNANQ